MVIGGKDRSAEFILTLGARGAGKLGPLVLILGPRSRFLRGNDSSSEI
jgi:hypothetical protein